MIQITRTQAAELRPGLCPEEAGPLVGLHVLQTGDGTVLVDRWPGPSAVLIETGGNYSLRGDQTLWRFRSTAHFPQSGPVRTRDRRVATR